MAMGNQFIAPMLVGSVTLDGMTIPAIVTPLYGYGNVSEYVCQHPSVNKRELVLQIALGLAYVHSLGETHGNMCVVSLLLDWHASMNIDTSVQENVVITDTGEARIMDIGVDSFWQDMVEDGRCRVPSKWMHKASEELESGIQSTQTDVYSFASTIYLVSRDVALSY